MPDEFFKRVGARIRELRIQSGMTQEQFGELAGMNRRFVGRVEAGDQNLSLLSLGRAAVALRTTPSALLAGIEPPASITQIRPRANARRRASTRTEGEGQ